MTSNRKTATPMKRISSPITGAEQVLFKMNPPLKGNEYVVASAVMVAYSGPETYLFPANENGDVIDWGELPGSYRGGISHTEALLGAGYEVGS